MFEPAVAQKRIANMPIAWSGQNTGDMEDPTINCSVILISSPNYKRVSSVHELPTFFNANLLGQNIVEAK